jgi:folate-binding protein YgfZ
MLAARFTGGLAAWQPWYYLHRMVHHVEDRAVIALSGPDRRSFLQGLITNNIDLLAPEKPIYAALLTPQGKILFDFLIVEDDAGMIFLDCPAPSRDGLIKRLAMYRLRSKVEIAPRDDLAIFASWDGSLLPGISFEDPRHAALGRRSIAPRADGQNGFCAHRLSLGVPEAADFGMDKMFALDAGLDELHAISFDKGCYVGQELTARMKHRGTARKRLLLVQSDTPLTVNTDLRANGHSLGEIVSVYDNRGFALVRLDRLAEAGDAPVEVAGKHVSLVKPSWLSGLT